MSLYYQCECGKKVNKLTLDLANSKEEILDLDYDIGVPLWQCPECGTRYKFKKIPRKIVNIVIFVWAVVCVALKLTFDITFMAWIFFIGLIVVGFVAGLVFYVFFTRFEKITDENAIGGTSGK